MTSGGLTGKILRVDLTAKEYHTESTEPYAKDFIGGRGIATKIIFDETQPKTRPLDPDSIICFAPGVLGGTPSPSTGRLVICGVSPENGLFGHAGVGSNIANEIKWSGYDLVVIKGKADRPVYLYIRDDTVEFRDAGHLWGKTTYDTYRTLRKELGQVAICCIGPSGEKQVVFSVIMAGIGSTAGRCGLGAVLGSKNVKAVVAKGSGSVKVAQPERFLKEAEAERKYFETSPSGTPAMIVGGEKNEASGWFMVGQGVWGNFEACDWEKEPIPNLDKENEFYNTYKKAKIGCSGCPIHHFSYYEVPGVGAGAFKCMARTNCTNVLYTNDVKLGFEAANLCQSYGIDVITTTQLIAALMEMYSKGIITAEDTDGVPMIKGDRNAIVTAIHKIGRQEGFGKLYGEGAKKGAKKLGKGAEDYVLDVRGRVIQPYEYRVIKQHGLAAVTSSKDIIDGMCCGSFDYGYTQFPKVDPEGVKVMEQIGMEKWGRKDALQTTNYEMAPITTVDSEDYFMAIDMLGLCKWAIPNFMHYRLNVFASILSSVTGVEMTEADMLNAAKRLQTLVRAFNVIRGLRRKDDTLPKRILEEPTPSGPLKGERLPREKFNEMLDEYYTLRGYDKEGIPKRETFEKYSLLSEWKVFEKALEKKK